MVQVGGKAEFRFSGRIMSHTWNTMTGVSVCSVGLSDGTTVENVPVSAVVGDTAPIDWNAPLEAYHPDGRVVAVEREKYGDHVIVPHSEVDAGSNFSFYEDGSHVVSKWRIRNRRTDDEWGAVIQVDHARPDWLRDDDERVYKRHDYPSSTDIHGRWQELSTDAVGWPTCDAIRLRVDHPYYTVQQHNEQHGTSFTYWPGGESAPDDWDGGGVLLRNGWIGDVHRWDQRSLTTDVIGYRRRMSDTIEYDGVTSREQAERIANSDQSRQWRMRVNGIEPTERMKQMGVETLMSLSGGVWQAAMSGRSFEMPGPVVDWLLASNQSDDTLPADVVDRMVWLVRDVADGNGADPGVVGNARAIVSDLPDEPVDPLLLRAREILADECDAKGLTVIAGAYRSGKRDARATMRAVLRALRERD